MPDDPETPDFLRDLSNQLEHIDFGDGTITQRHIARLNSVANLLDGAFAGARPAHPSILELSHKFPELTKALESDTQRWRNTLCRLAPHLMFDAAILGSALQDLCIAKYLSMDALKLLLEAEEIFSNNIRKAHL